ncbi:MAG: PEP-CTERM sorting domain-containing protein [Phycisphaeraceae bacterium]|nr:PEP-CTERM sorting domain-containing protein [Phycisphaeraceae bacterium]
MATQMKYLFVASLVWVMAAVTVQADPYPDQILKFDQQPMISLIIDGNEYNGHDELSTAYGNHLQGQYSGTYMADDFADRFDTPVVHVRWWGSYLNEQVGTAGAQKFLIAWETDVPVGSNNPYPYSHPGDLLQGEVVSRISLPVGAPPPGGSFTEKIIHPGGPSNGFEALYEYNAELACPFPQQPDTVYWLKIVALVDPTTDGNVEWGWHNRDYTIPDPLASVPPAVVPGEHDQRPLIDPGYPTPVWHFQDDAVQGSLGIAVNPENWCQVLVNQASYFDQYYVNGVDGPGPVPGVHEGIGQFSKDLAFQLYTIPEPTTLVLLSGVIALVVARRRI